MEKNQKDNSLNTPEVRETLGRLSGLEGLVVLCAALILRGRQVAQNVVRAKGKNGQKPL